MIQVKIDGVKISPIDITITKDLNNCCGDIQINVPGLEVKVNSEVLATINDKPIVRGRIEQKSVSMSTGELISGLYARDYTSILVDSTVPTSARVFKTGSSLELICKKVLGDLGSKIQVINKAGNIEPFKASERIVANAGQNALDFLSSYARKRNVFLNTDGAGNLVLFRIEDPEDVDYALTNIIDADLSIDFSGRFNKCIVLSQAEIYDDWGSAGSVNVRGEAQDPEIKDKELELQAETTMNRKECQSRAQEEVNIRRARSLTLRVKVLGHDYKIGDMVEVSTLGVSGIFLIEGLSYVQGLEELYTELDLTYPDAFAVKADMDSKTARKINISKHVRMP